MIIIVHQREVTDLKYFYIAQMIYQESLIMALPFPMGMNHALLSSQQ